MSQVMRVSYSILSCWARGDYERALAMYFREPLPSTPAMELGKKFHDEWEKEIGNTKSMPAVFGGAPLQKHSTELRTKREVMLNDWLQIVGVLDLLEGHIGRDWKSGKTPATAYSNGFQHKVYQVLYPLINQFEYWCYNPITGGVTMSLIHLSDQSLEEGVNWIMTHAGAMRAYLEQNNLWDRVVPVPTLADLEHDQEVDDENNVAEEIA